MSDTVAEAQRQGRPHSLAREILGQEHGHRGTRVEQRTVTQSINGR